MTKKGLESFENVIFEFNVTIYILQMNANSSIARLDFFPSKP